MDVDKKIIIKFSTLNMLYVIIHVHVSLYITTL